jgi:hypothetical protein
MRKFMTSTLGAIIALAGIAGTADAANFTDTSFGISIDVDDALTKQPLLRDIQSFISQDMSGSLVIRRVHDLTIIDFVDELRHAGYRDNRHNVVLRIAGEPFEADIDSGRGLLIPVQGQISGQPIRGVIGAYSGNDGHGFLIIGTTKTEDWAAWEPRMQTMFESVKFVEVDIKAMVKEWEDQLKGKKLQFKHANITSNTPAGMPGMPGMYYGGAMYQDYHLCSDGTVMRKSASVGQVAGQHMTVYGRSMNQGRGTWHVTVSKGEPFLVVRDGPEQGFRLEYDNDNFLLDGKPYLITASDLCK